MATLDRTLWDAEPRTVVDRVTSQGQHVEVKVGYGIAGAHAAGYVDGKYAGGQYGVNRRIPDRIKALGFAGAVGSVAVKPDEADAIESALAEARAAERAARESSPEGLESRRETLCDELAGLIDEEGHTRDRAWEREDERRACLTPADVEARIEAARRAIRDFDAAHPEVAERIEARKEAEVESFLRRD